MSTPTTSVTIANGTSDSPVILLGNNILVGIDLPTITSAAITLRVSSDGGTTYHGLYNTSGEVSWAASTGARYLAVNPNDVLGADYIKIRSGTDASAVTQGADRVLTLHFREKR